MVEKVGMYHGNGAGGNEGGVLGGVEGGGGKEGGAGGGGAGADAGAPESEGGKPLEKGALGSFCRAGLYDGPACLRELIKAGATANALDMLGTTPLHKAVANGDTRALRLLIGCSADVDAANVYGDTPLHRAIANSRVHTVTELLRHGADLDRPNKKGDTPLHTACANGNVALMRALLTAGAVVTSFNLKGYSPIHTAVHHGHRKILEQMIGFHNNRKIAWQTLRTQKTNDTPLHVAVRALRVNDLVWMVDYGGFSSALVLKNGENRDPIKLLKEAKKLLGNLAKYRKQAQKAAKTGRDPPAKKANIIFPPQNLPLPDGDARMRMAAQLPGQTHAYLLEEPTYVKFHTTPLPPPEPKGKKGKKEKVVPPPVFTIGLDEAESRLDNRGAKKIKEVLEALDKKYQEEKKVAEKIAAEKAKAKAQAEKEAKAKAAKDKEAAKKK